MVLSLDQTPSKYIPGSDKTMALKGSKNVPIFGSTDKRMITATFIITLDGKFLPPQLIYGGKTMKSLPRIEFPRSFSLSVNPKHYSNEHETKKVLQEVIIPYLEQERKLLQLPANHPALLIMDVFKGQTTNNLLQLLQENDIILQTVPANLTYLFQPLDVQGGPNGYVKRMMKKKCSTWYANEITKAMDAGEELEAIEIPLKLSIIKPLHAKWFIEMFNEMTSEIGRAVCLKGWVVAGIKGAVEKGLTNLNDLDPFNDCDPMEEAVGNLTNPTNMRDIEGCSKYIKG